MSRLTDWSHQLRYWAPPLLWASLIGVFSTESFSSASTFGYLHCFLQRLFPNADESFYLQAHIFLRKLAHPAEYFVLGVLVFCGFRAGARIGWSPLWAVGTMLVVALVAVGDEWHQYSLASRSGSLGDILLDICGGGCSLVGCYLRHCGRLRSTAGNGFI